MKKFFILLSSMILLTGCGSKTEEISNSENNSKPSVTESAITTESKVENTTPTQESEEFETFAWETFEKMAIPAGFVKDRKGAEHWKFMWVGNTESSDEVVFTYDTRIGYGDYEDDIPNFTLDDAPEICWERLNDSLSAHEFYANAETTENIEKLREDAMFLDFPAIHANGVLKTDKYDKQYTVSYSIYYTIVEFPNTSYGRVPAYVLAFAEGDSDALRSELDEIIATALKNSSIN